MSIATEIQRLQTAKTNIKTAIEEKGVTVGDGSIDTYAEKISEISRSEEEYQKGYEDGKQAEYDNFWDNYQQNGTLSDYTYMFGSLGWNDENFKPKYPIQPKIATNMFNSNKSIKNIDVTIDLTQATSANTMFAYANLLTTIKSLIVHENLDLSSTFRACNGLVNLGISGVIGKSISFQWSNQLSHESVENIINCLKDLTGSETQTLTLHATVAAKLTDEQKATITAKNWTLA